jgi:hypothetical protein
VSRSIGALSVAARTTLIARASIIARAAIGARAAAVRFVAPV